MRDHLSSLSQYRRHPSQTLSPCLIKPCPIKHPFTKTPAKISSRRLLISKATRFNYFLKTCCAQIGINIVEAAAIPYHCKNCPLFATRLFSKPSGILLIVWGLFALSFPPKIPCSTWYIAVSIFESKRSANCWVLLHAIVPP